MAKFGVMTPEELRQFVTEQIVGRQLLFDTPFGKKLKLYFDYTATGQELHFIKEIMTKIGDLYCNTHMETSITGDYTVSLMEEAKNESLKLMKADPERYLLVAQGSGCTAGIEAAQKLLGTYLPKTTHRMLLQMYPNTSWDGLKDQLRSKKLLPLVIVSHYEHLANEATWNNQLCDVVQCPGAGSDSHVDLESLEQLLKKHHSERNCIIGSFSAGSNITGLMTDVVSVAKTLKKYGALAFFDYGAIGSYVPIDLSQTTDDGRCLIDGIFVSIHKFIGGPGSCGICVFNKECYQITSKAFIDNNENNHGEEMLNSEVTMTPATPSILQLIQASLVLQLKSQLLPVINKRFQSHMLRLRKAIGEMPKFQLLGPDVWEHRCALAAFLIRHEDRYLHFNLVAKIFNDVFGIQATRSGCSWNGSYGYQTMGIDWEKGEQYQFWIEKHEEIGDDLQLYGFKPSWNRVTLHYALEDYEVDYFLWAVKYICDYGHLFLSSYNFNPINGEWFHTSGWTNPKPVLTFQDLAQEERQYASSEEERLKTFEKQKQDALDLLETLPPVGDLDSIPEHPQCFFYVEKGKILDRNLVERKGCFLKHQ